MGSAVAAGVSHSDRYRHHDHLEATLDGDALEGHLGPGLRHGLQPVNDPGDVERQAVLCRLDRRCPHVLLGKTIDKPSQSHFRIDLVLNMPISTYHTGSEESLG